MKNIDLEKSFSFLGLTYKDCWRSAIESTLYDFSKKKTYFLNKECLSEKIGKEIFNESNIFDFQSISTSENEIFEIRTSSINLKKNKFNFRNQDFIEKGKQEDLKNKIKFIDYKEISHDEVCLSMRNLKDDNIYSEINYNLEGKKFSIFFRCDYLNYSKTRFLLQPIHGRVPFLKDDKLYLAYVSTNIQTAHDKKITLEVLFGDYLKVFNLKFEYKIFKKLIKKFLNFIYPNVFKYENHLIIDNISIKFYLKNTEIKN